MKYSINKPLTMLNDLRIAGLLQALLFPLLTALLVNFSMTNTAHAQEGCTPLQIANNVENCNARGIHRKVLRRGKLRCGVSPDAPGFSIETAPGEFEGFDADLCRVIAAVVLGDPKLVKFVPLSSGERLDALNTGKVDVLMRITTATLSRDALKRYLGVGLNFGPVYFYDGQSLLVNQAGSGLNDIKRSSTIADLPDGTSVCLPPEFTGIAMNFLAAADAAGKTFDYVPLMFPGQEFEHLKNGVCDVITNDRTRLAGFKVTEIDNMTPPADDWVVLKQLLSKEPLVPMVVDKDDRWLDIVSWSVQALFFAEEEGITSSNIMSLRNSTAAISIVFGNAADRTAVPLGLDRRWAFRAIKRVGNYGEIYERHLPEVFLPRQKTHNALSEDGGLIYSFPLR